MSLKSKISISILMCLLLTFSIYSAQVPSVDAWGWGTHQFVDNKAIELMPDNLDWFFSTYSSVIIEYSLKPDQWKNLDTYEQNCRHWYHVDEPEGENEYYRGGLPNNWNTLGEGVLPWVVEDNFAMLVQSLRDEDWNHAAQLMGVISHYTTDATMPLHATSDYWLDGMHTTYESEVNGRLDEIWIPDYVPQELENIFESTMAVLEESYGFTGHTENDLSYWLRQYTSWNPAIRNITENRLGSAVQFTANLWYTAIIQADLETSPPTSEGLPTIVIMVIVTIAIVGTVSVLYIKRH